MRCTRRRMSTTGRLPIEDTICLQLACHTKLCSTLRAILCARGGMWCCVSCHDASPSRACTPVLKQRGLESPGTPDWDSNLPTT